MQWLIVHARGNPPRNECRSVIKSVFHVDHIAESVIVLSVRSPGMVQSPEYEGSL